jgi:hypothetical protein
MEWLDADVRSLQTALEQTPEILDPVRVNVAFDVGFRVVDDRVDIFTLKAVVADPRIR